MKYSSSVVDTPSRDGILLWLMTENDLITEEGRIA
jgi:hypothetical protein